MHKASHLVSSVAVLGDRRRFVGIRTSAQRSWKLGAWLPAAEVYTDYTGHCKTGT